MKRPLHPAGPAALLLAGALAAPSRAAVDLCVAANNLVQRGGSAREAFQLAQPRSDDRFGRAVRWSAAEGCRRVFHILGAAGEASRECGEDDYGEALASLCQGRRDRASESEEATRRDAQQLASRLEHQALDETSLAEYQAFRSGSRPADLRKQVDDAFEKGLIRRMGESAYRNGGQQPAAAQLDTDPYYAAWKRLKRDPAVLQERVLAYQGTLRMQAEARRRQDADYAAARQAAERQKQQEAAVAAAAAKNAQCGEFRQMQQENGCRRGSLNSVCIHAGQQLSALGC